jgi:hypothetical protein
MWSDGSLPTFQMFRRFASLSRVMMEASLRRKPSLVNNELETMGKISSVSLFKVLSWNLRVLTK